MALGEDQVVVGRVLRLVEVVVQVLRRAARPSGRPRTSTRSGGPISSRSPRGPNRRAAAVRALASCPLRSSRSFVVPRAASYSALSCWCEGRCRVRPPRREAARARARGSRRARPRGGRPRHRPARAADRLPGQGARARRARSCDGRRRPRRSSICGSGVGASVAACKIAGIRAAICHDIYSAHQGVEHDDMNVLCLGSEVVGAELAADLVRAFLAAEFDGGERYVRRLEKIEEIEEMRHMAKSPSAPAVGARAERLDRLPLARPAAPGRARADDGGGRRRRRHVEPDDLPEGDLAGRRLRRAAARAAARTRTTRRRSSSSSPARDVERRVRPVPRRLGRRPRACDGYVSIEVDPTSPTTREATIEQAQRFTSWIDKPNLYVKIPATKAGLPRDRGDDRARQARSTSR